MIVRWFTHEVSDLEPVLSSLQKQDRRDFEVSLVGHAHYHTHLIRPGKHATCYYCGCLLLCLYLSI